MKIAIRDTREPIPKAREEPERTYRIDSVPIQKAQYTKEGYLLDRPVLTTCGIFEYTNEDGSIRRELRLPEEVFDPESLKSYKGKPVIVTHNAVEVSKDNVSQEQIGTILSEGVRDGNDVRADIIIHDSKKLSLGLRELSVGYYCDQDETPGVWEGKPYDLVQRNIRVNHLALVPEARAGHRARLNLDGKSHKGGKKEMSEATREDGVKTLTPEQLTEAIRMYLEANPELDVQQQDGAGEAPDPIEMIRQKAQARGEDISSVKPEAIPEMQEDIDRLLAEIDRLKGAGDMTEGSNPEEDPPAKVGDGGDGSLKEPGEPEVKDPDPEDLIDPGEADDPEDEMNQDGAECPVNDPPKEKQVKLDGSDNPFADIMELCKMASKLGIADFAPTSVLDGKKRIIASVKPGLKLDGKSDAYIDGAYEVACQNAAARKSSAAKLREAAGDPSIKLDGADASSKAEKAKKDMMNRLYGNRTGGNE